MSDQSMNPGTPPPPPSGMPDPNLIKEICLPIYQSKFWLQLLGVVMILNGLFAAITIVGIIIAWLPIWLGIILFKAASAAQGAQLTGDKFQLMASLRNIKLYFLINGVLMLIVLGFLAFAFLFGGMAALMGGGGY